MGKTVGAAVALSAAVFLAPQAHALSELEELMGEPVKALSDNELSDLRGGFVTVRGVKFDIGVKITETVNGQVLRQSTAVLSNLRNRRVNLPRNVSYRRPDDQVDPDVKTTVTEVVTNDVVDATTTKAVPAQAVEMTFNTSGNEQVAVKDGGEISVQSGLGAVVAPGSEETIGSSAEAALAGSNIGNLFEVAEVNNSNIKS